MGFPMGPRPMPFMRPPPQQSLGILSQMKASSAGPRPFAAEKSTTVYCGKIATTLDDSIVQRLLEACGKIKSWKRAEDPETHEQKSFGFCEYEDAEGVLRAIRFLNGLKIDGQELLLKGNSATQKYIEEYEQNKVIRPCGHAAVICRAHRPCNWMHGGSSVMRLRYYSPRSCNSSGQGKGEEQDGKGPNCEEVRGGRGGGRGGSGRGPSRG